MTDQPGPMPNPAVAEPRPLTAPPPADLGTTAAGAEPDWTDQVTELVVDTVDKVRSRTTGPIIGVVRASVYAVVAIIIAIPVVILGLAGLVRLLNWILPGDVWVAYVVLGIVFALGGVYSWSKRQPTATP